MAAALDLGEAALEQIAAQTGSLEQEREFRLQVNLPDCRFAVCVPGYEWKDLTRNEQQAVKEMIGWKGRQTFWDDKQKRAIASSDLMIGQAGDWAIVKVMPLEGESKGNFNLKMGCVTHHRRRYWKDIVGIVREHSEMSPVTRRNKLKDMNMSGDNLLEPLLVVETSLKMDAENYEAEGTDLTRVTLSATVWLEDLRPTPTAPAQNIETEGQKQGYLMARIEPLVTPNREPQEQLYPNLLEMGHYEGSPWINPGGHTSTPNYGPPPLIDSRFGAFGEVVNQFETEEERNEEDGSWESMTESEDEIPPLPNIEYSPLPETDVSRERAREALREAIRGQARALVEENTRREQARRDQEGKDKRAREAMTRSWPQIGENQGAEAGDRSLLAMLSPQTVYRGNWNPNVTGGPGESNPRPGPSRTGEEAGAVSKRTGGRGDRDRGRGQQPTPGPKGRKKWATSPR